jgi:dTDP-4-amino-4,6-dideoxygalactose transaminase
VIPFNRASFDGNELRYLQEAIAAGHVSGNGPLTMRAEHTIESRMGAGRALLTTSCTHALEMAALLLNLRPHDEVIVPSFTFVTTASAFMLHGGTPVFVDIDPRTLNIDPDAVEAAITDRTRAVVVVHYAGVGVGVERISKICERNGLVLIEDNAHGLFGRHNNRLLGSFGSLATQSFHETKNITCGEGGALLVNDPELVERAEILREKGTNRSRFLRGQVDKYTWVDNGSSYVLSDLLAGVLLGQLERFEDIQDRRHEIWDRYAAGLSDWAAEWGVVLPDVTAHLEHTAHMFHLRLDSGADRDGLIAHLRAAEVMAVFHYQPLHLSEVGRSLGGREGQFPVSERVADRLVRLPLYASLSAAQQDHVIKAVRTYRPSSEGIN